MGLQLFTCCVLHPCCCCHHAGRPTFILLQHAAHTRYEQERHAQHDEPAGGASTSNVLPAAKQRDRVKFAGGEEAAVASAGLHQLTDDEHGGSTPVAVVTRAGFFSFTRPKVRVGSCRCVRVMGGTS